MSEYNGLMNTHFKSCQKLAEVHDPHRDRMMAAFFIGREDLVGISDGVDSWLAHPDSLIHLKVKEPLARALAGQLPMNFQEAPPRRRAVLDSSKIFFSSESSASEDRSCGICKYQDPRFKRERRRLNAD